MNHRNMYSLRIKNTENKNHKGRIKIPLRDPVNTSEKAIEGLSG